MLRRLKAIRRRAGIGEFAGARRRGRRVQKTRSTSSRVGRRAPAALLHRAMVQPFKDLNQFLPEKPATMEQKAMIAMATPGPAPKPILLPGGMGNGRLTTLPNSQDVSMEIKK